MNHKELMNELRQMVRENHELSHRAAHVKIIKNETEDMSDKEKSLHAQWRKAYDARPGIDIGQFPARSNQMAPSEWESRTGKDGAE